MISKGSLLLSLMSLSCMSTGYGIKKGEKFQRLGWTWTKAAGKYGKKSRLAPHNIFTTLGPL
jgi:hypothetical protein